MAGGVEEVGGLALVSLPSGGAIADDGRVAVVDRMGRQVVVLGEDGRVERTLGRDGDGPGEFRDPRFAGFWGDSLLWVSDATSGRISVFGRDGSLSSTLTRPWEPVPGSSWSAQGRWALRGGAVLGSVSGPREQRGGVYPELPLVVWSAEGAMHVADWLPTEGPSAMQILTPAGPSIGGTQPINAAPITGVDRSGSWFFSLDRSPHSGSTALDSIVIDRRDGEGRSLGRTAIPYRPVPAGEAVRTWLAHQGQWRSEALNESLPENLGTLTPEDVTSAIWVPEFIPPVREALADENGFWLQREMNFPTSADGPNLWERYDLSGTLLRWVELPAGVSGIAGTEDSILGFSMGELRVPTLYLFTVSEP